MFKISTVDMSDEKNPLATLISVTLHAQPAVSPVTSAVSRVAVYPRPIAPEFVALYADAIVFKTSTSVNKHI